MIIICLVNIYHLIYIQNKRKRKNFFLVMRTLRTYFLNNFLVQHITMLTIFIMLYLLSLIHIYLITGSLCLLTAFIQFLFPSLPASGNPKSDLSLFLVNVFILIGD